MRIALFTDTYTPDVNGVALTLNRWVDYLNRHGHQVIVFAPEPDQKVEFEKQIKRYKSYPFFLYPELQAAIVNPLDVKQRLLDFQPDIVHVATPFNLGIFGRRYALKYDIPFVASYHTNFDQYLQSYKLEWAKPVLDRYLAWFHQECQGVFAPSKDTARQLNDQAYPNVKIWPRGVDHKQFEPAQCKLWAKNAANKEFGLHKNKTTILYVGRLAQEKSIDVLIDTIKELPLHLQHKIEVALVGDGPIRQNIQEVVDKYDLPVKLLGFLKGDDLTLAYQTADIFFFPSSTETFGNVVLEALSCGLPVIGANAGGVKELVISAHNGILCPPGNKDSFSDALTFLINQPTVRKYYGAKAREFALKQSWDTIMGDLLAEFEAIQKKRMVLRA